MPLPMLLAVDITLKPPKTDGQNHHIMSIILFLSAIKPFIIFDF